MPERGVQTLSTRELAARGLHDAIVEFDRANMAPILEEAGIEFPEAKRRKAFEVDGIYFLVLDSNREILAYLELCPDWENPKEDHYISSLQIKPGHRNGSLFRRLLVAGLRHLQDHGFRFLKSAVQKSNLPAIQMYRKLGFTIAENPKNEKTLLLSANPSILSSHLAKRLTQSGLRRRSLGL